MEDKGRISDLQFMPIIKERRGPFDGMNKPKSDLEDIVTNPVILSSIISAGTGKKFVPPIWGKLGSRYMKSIINQSMTLDDIGFDS